MYPFHRLVMIAGKHILSRRKKVEDVTQKYTFHFRPGLGDIDLYPEVNNGRHFVFCDLARYDFALKIGLVKYIKKEKYLFVVGGSTIRYRKRLRPFRKSKIDTKFVGFNEKFFYFHHAIQQNGAVSSSAIVRTGIRDKNGTINPEVVMKGLGFDVKPFMEPWVAEWINWDDETHQWPNPDK
jgi:acyl-CoA thioesterase FadM